AADNLASTTVTRSTSVTVRPQTSETAPLEVQLANSPDFAGAVWQPLAPSLPWVLLSGDSATKTVYVRLRDRAQNVSAAATGVITLDTTAPSSPTVTLDGGAAVTGGTSASVALGVDPGSNTLA